MAVKDPAAEVQRLRNEILGRLDDGWYAVTAWQERVRAGYEAVEKREAVDPGIEGYAGIPEGAPRQYAAVAEQVERGECTWIDVLDRNSDDPDTRAVRTWLEGRVDLARRAWAELERGVDPDGAIATATEEQHRKSRFRG